MYCFLETFLNFSISIFRRWLSLDKGIKKELLDILACPKCNASLKIKKDKKSLICSKCKANYEINQGIPVLIPKKWFYNFQDLNSIFNNSIPFYTRYFSRYFNSLISCGGTIWYCAGLEPFLFKTLREPVSFGYPGSNPGHSAFLFFLTT